jgi:hypothetical protein
MVIREQGGDSIKPAGIKYRREWLTGVAASKRRKEERDEFNENRYEPC